MSIIRNFTNKIKTALLILAIILSAAAFAIQTPQPVRSMKPDLIIFEQPESRAVFVTANGQTWVMEVI